MTTLLKRLLGRGQGPIPYEAARETAGEGSAGARRRLAAREDARPEILYYFTDDADPGVRQAVARNPATPRQADAKLADDADDEVRCELARKIARLAPTLSADAADKIARLTLQTLEKLAADQLPRVRRIVAEEIKHCDNLPRGLIRRLAADAELAVAAPVLEYSPLLSDEDLLEIIGSDPIRGALAAIARRPGLRAPVTEAIVDSPDHDAVTALLANSSAQIREEALDRIVDAAPTHESWHTPLVRRGELSVRAIARIATFVSLGLLRVLEERHDLPPDAIKDVRRVVKERIEKDMAAGKASEAGATKGEQRDFSALTDEQLTDALLAGDNGLVRAALAARSKIAPERVDRILASQSGKAVTALVWKAGYSMRTAVAAQMRLARVPHDRIVNAKDGVDYPIDPEELTRHLALIS